MGDSDAAQGGPEPNQFKPFTQQATANAEETEETEQMAAQERMEDISEWYMRPPTHTN